MPSPLVLASGSPRRKELLTSAGFTFVVDVADVDETPPANTRGAAAIAAALAKRKALAVAPRRKPGEIVLAADTVVWIDGALLGKPADDAEARRMLRLLSGKEHEVATGWCAMRVGGGESAGAAITRVTFDALTDEQIAAYIATREPFDKAGGYAIQGHAGVFVRRIAGSYSNVVGLPLAEVCASLAEISDLRPFGVPP